jgi:DNA-binding CsgD family transcriptional regulator/PAS domain-containing protein
MDTQSTMEKISVTKHRTVPIIIKGRKVSGHSADEAIAALYAAAVAPEQWGKALEVLTRLADARAANCFVHDALTEHFIEYRFIGYGENWARDYASHYHSLDLARRVLLREPAGRMHAMHRYVSESMVQKSEYYQDFYIREGLRYSCGGTLFDGNQRLILAVHRPVGHSPYDEHVIAELQRVLNHLPHVFRVRELVTQGRVDASMSCAALDALPRAVVIVDANATIRYINRAASVLLDQADDMHVRSSRLSLSDPRLARQLSQRIEKACQPPQTVDPVPLYTVDANGRPSAELHVVPLDPALAAGVTSAHPMAMILMRRPFQRADWSGAIARPYSLSPAELGVATALVEGLTPAEYALRSGVKISTVRSQIKSIMAKTGTRRMPEIATLFAGIDNPLSDRSLPLG